MDLEELADRLDESADRVGPEVERTVHRQAILLRGRIRANASGRPGPNVITGAYRSSWEIDSFPVPHGGGAEVGTEKPQAKRLEFGFYNMTDSLGRHFFQPPFPHVEPAVNAISAEYEQAFREALDRIFGGG
ncbi:HK97 gp10 family phage protein [Streptomyces olivaceiscleroticus]|uniref:HK97 gp10 family phage protein n=1 Tax=Streptomyces olivaceiscleroticus TaxID=68245 RepID=A0ABP3LID7_9ACTN